MECSKCNGYYKIAYVDSGKRALKTCIQCETSGHKAVRLIKQSAVEIILLATAITGLAMIALGTYKARRKIIRFFFQALP